MSNLDLPKQIDFFVTIISVFWGRAVWCGCALARCVSLYPSLYVCLQCGSAAVPWRAACLYTVCVCAAAVPWRAACLYIRVYMCDYCVVVRLCLGALHVSI